LPELAIDRLELMTEVAEAEMEQGHFGAARDALDDAERGAGTLGNDRLHARQALVRTQLRHITSGSIGDPAQVASDVRRMIPTFEAEGDAAGLARAWRQLWVISGTTGDLEGAAKGASRVVEIASASGEIRLAARAAVAYAQAALESAMPVGEAIRRCQELIGAVANNRIAEAQFLAILSVLHAMEGRFDEARELYQRRYDAMADAGPSLSAAGASLETSRVEMLAGEPAAAERELRRDLVLLESVDERYTRSTVAGLLGHALYALGRFDEAAKYVAVAETLAGEDDLFTQVTWRTARAKLLAHGGARETAVALAREAVAMAGTGSYIEQQAEALMDLAEVLRTIGGGDPQEAPLKQALELFERKGDVVSAARVRRLLALTPRGEAQ
jgi:tetratricopeptide (TPR) repeat protein